MRVLTIYYTHKPGGFCKRLYRLLNALQARGVNVHYLCLDHPPAALNSSVRYHRIPFPLKNRSSLLFWLLFTAWCPIYTAWVALLLRPKRYVVFNPYYSTMVGLASVIAPAPIVLFARALVYRIDDLKQKSPVLLLVTSLVDRIGFRIASTVVCMTQSMRIELEKFCRLRFQSSIILPNDVPELSHNVSEPCPMILEVLQRKDPNELLALTACTIDRVKNLDYLLNVFTELNLSQTGNNIRLFVAGDGPLLSHYRQKTTQLGLSNIIFLGWCESLWPLLSEVDLLIHPSLAEGVPNTVMEALAADVPVLASNIPELRELLCFDELLFDPHDPLVLKDKLLYILSNPDSRLAELAALGTEVKTKLTFDWDTQACNIVLDERGK